MSTAPRQPDDPLGPLPAQTVARPAYAPTAPVAAPPVDYGRHAVAQPAPIGMPQVILAAVFGAIGAAVVMMVGLWFLLPVLAPEREPRPEDTLIAACRQYRKTQGEAFLQAQSQVESGEIKTLADLVKALQEHARPVADALNDAAKRCADDKGTITEPNRLGDLLGRVGKALQRR